jgi:RNA polymerase sigma-70 factor (ECF subfamily)
LDAIVASATGSEGAAFSELATRHRCELQAHCHRMLGSYEESEDLVQETFLRAWRSRTSFRGDASFRAWLYRIATNACHDALQRRLRRPQRVEVSFGEAVEGTMATDAEPDDQVVSKETTELVFMAAIQHLPPKQRAVLVLRGVLGLSARDAASLLEASVPSVNSALQRARGTLKHRLPEQRLEWTRPSGASEEDRALLQRYLDAIERADAKAFVEETLGERAAVTIHGSGKSKGDERWP